MAHSISSTVTCVSLDETENQYLLEANNANISTPHAKSNQLSSVDLQLNYQKDLIRTSNNVFFKSLKENKQTGVLSDVGMTFFRDDPELPVLSTNQNKLVALVKDLKAHFPYVKIFIGRLILSIIAFIGGLFFQSCCIVASDQFYTIGSPPLKDRVHDFFGGKPTTWMTFDTVNFFCSLLFIGTVIRFTVFVPIRISLAVWTRFFWCLAFLYSLRGVAIFVTTMPSTTALCHVPTIANHSQFFQVVFSTFSGQTYACTDLIISGHTLFATSLFMLWIYYSYRSRLAVLIIMLYWMWCLNAINISFLHYTVDVFLASILAIFSWLIFHMLLDAAALRCVIKLANESFVPVGNNLEGDSDSGHSTEVGYSFLTNFYFSNKLLNFITWIDGLEYRIRYFLNKYSTMNLQPKQLDDHNPKQIDSSSVIVEIFDEQDSDPAPKFVPLSDKISSKNDFNFNGFIKQRKNLNPGTFDLVNMRSFHESYAGDGSFHCKFLSYFRSYYRFRTKEITRDLKLSSVRF